MSKYVNEPINYQRFKHVSMDKISSENDKWEVKRKTITKGFDPLLHRWVIVDTGYKFLPMSEVGAYKELIQNIYVKRVALGADLKEVSKWFKVRRKVSVLNRENNIFLTQADGRIFQTDLEMTSPMNLNYVPEGIKIEKLDESALTQKELIWLERQLSDEKVYIKPLCCSELQNGELRISV